MLTVKIADLKPLNSNYPQNKDLFTSKYLDVKYDYNNKTKSSDKVFIKDNFMGDIYHSNYLKYLEKAWGNHYGVVMSPDILWYTLLSEITLIVAEDSSLYSHLFTDQPDKKKEILVQSDSEYLIPLDTLIEAIKNNVPCNIDAFLPNFSTTVESSKFAKYAAFADIVSPYYQYSMYCCGIPFINIEGTKDDYLSIVDNFTKIGNLLNSHQDYFNKVLTVLSNIVNNIDSPNFWDKMFYLEKCGSGSQNEVFGWFTELFRVQPKDIRFSDNFSSHLAKIDYENVSIHNNYIMYNGLLNSHLEDGLLIPEFSYMVYKKLKTPLITRC